MLSDQSGFSLGLWRCNTERLYATLELYDDVRTLGVVARLAKVIFIHAGRGEVQDGVACRQRDLADLLGVSEVSVAGALKTLENAGLIKRHYRCISVPRMASLEAWLQANHAI